MGPVFPRDLLTIFRFGIFGLNEEEGENKEQQRMRSREGGTKGRKRRGMKMRSDAGGRNNVLRGTKGRGFVM